MTLAAWQSREKAAAEAGETLETPDFILRMRSKLTDDGHFRHSVSENTASMRSNQTPSAFEWGVTGLTSANQPTGQSNQSNTGYYNTNVNPTGQYFFSPDNMGAVDWSMFDNMLSEDLITPAYGNGFVENGFMGSDASLWGTSNNQGYQ